MGVTRRTVEGSHVSTHFVFGEERQVVGLGREPGSGFILGQGGGARQLGRRCSALGTLA